MSINLPPIGALQQRGIVPQAPQSRGRILAAGAPSPQTNSLGRGLAGLGQGLAAVGQAVEQSRQQQRREAFLQSVFEPDQAERNSAMAATGGPTNAAAEMMNTSASERLAARGVPRNVADMAAKAWEAGDKQAAWEIAGQYLLAGPQERKILTGADGYQYYQDTGERVLPNVNKPAEMPSTREIKRDGRVITQQWNPTTGAFEELGSSPQFAPQAAQKPTFENLTDGKTTRRVQVGTPRYYQMLEKGWYGGDASSLVPGRDVPFSQEVVDQKVEVARAGAGMNESQSKAAGFADRMFDANQYIEQYTQAGLDMGERAKSNVPLVGNYLVSPEYQQFDQAQRDFVNAVLRRESGAVISPSEFDNAAQQYFPQPGDSPEVVAQKARNRVNAILGTQRAAGPNYEAPLAPAASLGGDAGTVENPIVPTSAQDIETAPVGSVMRTPKRGLVQKQEDGTWAPVDGNGGQDPSANVRGMGPSSRP